MSSTITLNSYTYRTKLSEEKTNTNSSTENCYKLHLILTNLSYTKLFQDLFLQFKYFIEPNPIEYLKIMFLQYIYYFGQYIFAANIINKCTNKTFNTETKTYVNTGYSKLTLTQNEITPKYIKAERHHCCCSVTTRALLT